MAIRYKALTELYLETQRSVTAPDQWRAFLASACRNYRLSFDEQLLVYAQRPDATAVLEIERWNRQFGRWVNRGANGIAVFDGEHNGKPRLKYYFDISDTHEARFPRPVPLWTVREEYAPDIIETLENSFGELERKEDLEKLNQRYLSELERSAKTHRKFSRWMAGLCTLLLLLFLAYLIFFDLPNPEYGIIRSEAFLCDNKNLFIKP